MEGSAILTSIWNRISIYLWAFSAGPIVLVLGWLVGKLLALVGLDGSYAMGLYTALYDLDFAAALLFFWFAIICISQPIAFLRPAVISLSKPCHDAITAVLGALLGLSVILAIGQFQWRILVMPLFFIALFEILVAVLRRNAESLNAKSWDERILNSAGAGAMALFLATGIWYQT